MINWSATTELKRKINLVCASMDAEHTGRRLFALDAFLWKRDSEEQNEIIQRLGWLNLPDRSELNVNSVTEFAEQIREEGYKHVVLLGMGGSSLCSEVTRKTFAVAKGYLPLLVLDDTDPAQILALENKIDIGRTLFIVASKSGNTMETLCFFHYFHDQLVKKNKKHPGANFIAITDAGTPLTKLAEHYCFKKVFITPSDIGGRYSVLSDFGLVPMALTGIDIKAILKSAGQMKSRCKSNPAAKNPGILLGIILGVCQQNGRDKVSFILSSSIKSFGYWVEQLLAESTGKEGRGLVPVNGELTGTPAAYGNDRLFIHMYLPGDDNQTDEAKLKDLEKAGHTIVRIEVADKIALGGEYYRWEIAVAIAGILIGINPFDQPDVEKSKLNTTKLLEGWIKEGSFKDAEDSIKKSEVQFKNSGTLQNSIAERLKIITGTVLPNDYIALLPYFPLTPARAKLLQLWRQQMRNTLKVATTLLNGPRYLHSTGQLHKGGPDTGIYLILIGNEEEDLPIPGEKFGFSTLHRAQALGDLRSLKDKGRRVLLVSLGKNIDAGLTKLCKLVKKDKTLLIQQVMV